MECTTIERRVIQDANGFYRKQIRFIPLEVWECGDGWRTTYISSVPLEDCAVVLNEKEGA